MSALLCWRKGGDWRAVGAISVTAVGGSVMLEVPVIWCSPCMGVTLLDTASRLPPNGAISSCILFFSCTRYNNCSTPQEPTAHSHRSGNSLLQQHKARPATPFVPSNRVLHCTSRNRQLKRLPNLFRMGHCTFVSCSRGVPLSWSIAAWLISAVTRRLPPANTECSCSRPSA